MSKIFDMASDLESVCVGLNSVEDLLNISLNDIFWARNELSDYAQQFETLIWFALTTVQEQEKEVHRISDWLYEINKQFKESE